MNWSLHARHKVAKESKAIKQPRVVQSWPRRCIIKGCRRKVNKINRNNKCPKHQSQEYKRKYPLKYYFNALRNRARQRGHSFTISYNFYEALCKWSGYDINRGKTAQSLSIDRIDSTRGYHEDNVRITTLSFNSRREYVRY